MRKLFWKTWSTGSKWSYLPTRIAPFESLFDKKDNNKDVFSSNGSKPSTHHDGSRPSQYLNHTDIKQRAIQVLYTEGARGGVAEGGEHRWWYIKVIHPNKPFRRIFDVMTVIWVLYLVFFIPLEIGFSWFVESSRQKKFLSFLDVWFAVDFILNFRTGYICHGTVIMDQKRIIWYDPCCVCPKMFVY